MTLKFYDSPFHVTHDKATASKLAMKMDLSIMLTKLINERGWTQQQAADQLSIQQSRVSDLTNGKVEKFTVDAMLDMLDCLGYRSEMNMPNLNQALITIHNCSNLSR